MITFSVLFLRAPGKGRRERERAGERLSALVNLTLLYALFSCFTVFSVNSFINRPCCHVIDCMTYLVV